MFEDSLLVMLNFKIYSQFSEIEKKFQEDITKFTAMCISFCFRFGRELVAIPYFVYTEELRQKSG